MSLGVMEVRETGVVEIGESRTGHGTVYVEKNDTLQSLIGQHNYYYYFDVCLLFAVVVCCCCCFFWGVLSNRGMDCAYGNK